MNSDRPDPLDRRSSRATAWAPVALFTIAALLVLLDRSRVLTQFAFKYTDQDQALLWCQASEAAHGRFHEPCFFGQAYSPAIEAWVAAPMVLAGVGPHVALPLTTALLALIPFFVVAGAAFASGHRWAAVAIVLVPSALPVEYGMVTSMSRGFVTGVFFATPAAVLWLLGSHGRRWCFLVAASLAVLAITANPNSSILLLFAGTFAVLMHWRRWAFWAMSGAGALIGAPCPLLIWYFYRVHPGYVMHPSPELRFSLANITAALGKMDVFLGHFAPWKHNGWSVVALFLFIVVLLCLLRQYKAAIATSTALLFIMLSLGLSKVHDCNAFDGIFFSGSRMYLAVPLVIALCILWLDRGLGQRQWSLIRIPAVSRLLVIIGLCAVAVSRDTTLLEDPRPAMKDAWPVFPCSVEHLTQVANAITPFAKQNATDLLLILDFHAEALNYAAPILTEGAYETLLPWQERRTWRLQEEQTRRRPSILVYVGKSSTLDDSVLIRNNDGTETVRSPAVLLTQSGGLSAIEVARNAGYPVRPY